MTFISDRSRVVEGNLVEDPKVRERDGKTSVMLKIAENERLRDRDTGEWKDGGTRFWTAWVNNKSATNVADSLSKGMRVVIVGDAKVEMTEKDGTSYLNFSMYPDVIAPVLTSFQKAQVSKSSSGNSGNSGQSSQSPKPKAASVAGIDDDSDF